MYVSVRAQRLKLYVRLHRSNQSSAPEFILIMCSDVRGEVTSPRALATLHSHALRRISWASTCNMPSCNRDSFIPRPFVPCDSTIASMRVRTRAQFFQIRFASTIAQRLRELGALTRGDRRAAVGCNESIEPFLFEHPYVTMVRTPDLRTPDCPRPLPARPPPDTVFKICLRRHVAELPFLV